MQICVPRSDLETSPKPAFRVRPERLKVTRERAKVLNAVIIDAAKHKPTK